MKSLFCRTRHWRNSLGFILFIFSIFLIVLFYWISGIQSVKKYFILNHQPKTVRHTSQHRASEYESRKLIYHKYYRPLETQSFNCTKLVAGDKLTIKHSYESRKLIYHKYYRPLETQNVNCTGLVAGDKLTIKHSYELMKKLNSSTRNIKQDVFTTNCSYFRRSRGYIEHALSDFELNFPLAFGMAVYKDIEQVERLLRAIYRPHNSYCIHVDKKSDFKFHQHIAYMASCFDNVYVTQESVDVVWGEMSLLQAELFMMEEVLKHKKWKYYINLTGQEFPLKTNKELVAILQAMKGANIVEAITKKEHSNRWEMKIKPPPHNITLVKGAVHVAVNRYFVDFCINDQRAKDFIVWLNGTVYPDETLFASLNQNPSLNISGSFLGDAQEYTLKPFFVRYKNWMTRPCTGRSTRGICIVGTGDVHRAYADVGLFVNKFHLDYQYLGYDCLEEVLHEKTWQQYLDDEDIDVQYYTHLDYVKYRL